MAFRKQHSSLFIEGVKEKAISDRAVRLISATFIYVKFLLFHCCYTLASGGLKSMITLSSFLGQFKPENSQMILTFTELRICLESFCFSWWKLYSASFSLVLIAVNACIKNKMTLKKGLSQWIKISSGLAYFLFRIRSMVLSLALEFSLLKLSNKYQFFLLEISKLRVFCEHLSHSSNT